VTDPAPSDDSAAAKRRRLVDLAPLKASPAFARLYFGSAISGIGAQLTVVAVGLQIYDITGSTFAVGLVGGIALVPMIVAGLWGGMLADSFDRRTVAIVSAVAGWLATLGLVTLAVVDLSLARGTAPVWPLYVLTTINAVASTISFSTRGAIAPRLLPTHLIAPASAMNGIAFGVQLTVGPALAGVLVATVGFAWTYAVDAILFAVLFIAWSYYPHGLPLPTRLGATVPVAAPAAAPKPAAPAAPSRPANPVTDITPPRNPVTDVTPPRNPVTDVTPPRR